MILLLPVSLACVASVSVRFSARSRHFSSFSRAKIGASAKKCVTGEGKGEKETSREGGREGGGEGGRGGGL